MSTKKINFTNSEIRNLPNDKPTMYHILTKSGKNNYTGIAHKGRVQERLQEHLGKIPGATIIIKQCKTIKEARTKESNAIKKLQPKYNIQGK